MAKSSTPRQSPLIRTLTLSSITMVILIAIGSFWISYDALKHLAADHGNPAMAWLFPLLIDGSLVIYSVNVFLAELTGNDTRFSFRLVIVMTITSVIFNILHAEPTFISRFISALPPILLFLSVEVALRQARMQVGMGVRKTAHQGKFPEKPESSGSTVSPVAERRKRVRNLKEKSLSPKQIASNLGCSIQTIYRDLKALSESQVEASA